MRRLEGLTVLQGLIWHLFKLCIKIYGVQGKMLLHKKLRGILHNIN